MSIPVFWTTAISDHPWNFKEWFDQFLMAVTVKENVNTEIMLEDPKPVIEEPESRPETPRTYEDANAVTARETRDKLMRDRVTSSITKCKALSVKVISCLGD